MVKSLPYIFSILLFIVFLEFGIRVSGVVKKNSEKRGDGYLSYYNQKIDSWFHLWSPNSTIPFHQSEFSYTYQSNSLGLIEKELTQNKDSNTYRLLCIGDSFTQGDGAPQDESFPRFLENLLNGKSDTLQYEVINAGVCGSDVFFMHKLLKHKLINYNLDGIIFLLGTSDIEDIIFRGGSERFNADTTTTFRRGPWYEPFYKYSHLVRVVLHGFGMNEMLLFPKKSKEKYTEALALYKEEIKRINSELEKYPYLNSIMIAFLAPHEINAFTYEEVEYVIQLNNAEKFQFHPKSLALNIIENPNVKPIFEECYQAFKPLPYEQYAWPINGHFNAYGYKKLAEIIYESTLANDSSFFNLQP